MDKPSEGLILLTNDGNIVNKILRARNNHEKEYIVGVNRLINRDFIQSMSNGVEILDTITKNCFVEQLGPKNLKIVLTQGLNRQIRRMCQSLGYRVQSLKRVRIMNIKLDIPTGKYRKITKEELFELNRLLENSSKTHITKDINIALIELLKPTFIRCTSIKICYENIIFINFDFYITAKFWTNEQ